MRVGRGGLGTAVPWWRVYAAFGGACGYAVRVAVVRTIEEALGALVGGRLVEVEPLSVGWDWEEPLPPCAGRVVGVRLTFALDGREEVLEVVSPDDELVDIRGHVKVDADGRWRTRRA